MCHTNLNYLDYSIRNNNNNNQIVFVAKESWCVCVYIYLHSDKIDINSMLFLNNEIDLEAIGSFQHIVIFYNNHAYSLLLFIYSYFTLSHQVINDFM